MSHPPRFPAFDPGAESGRLTTEEIHRFRNGPVAAGGRLDWDILHLWDEMQTGLAMAGGKYGKDLAGVGGNLRAVFGVKGRIPLRSRIDRRRRSE